jgi:hypothetical protein
VFHAKDGWFFERTDDSDVRIVKTDGKLGGPTIVEGVLPTDTWASVVASVSVGGETLQTWQQALGFHNGLPPHYDSSDNNAWIRANYGLDPLPSDPGYEEWTGEQGKG